MNPKKFVLAAAVFGVTALVVILFVKSRGGGVSGRQNNSRASITPQPLPLGAENSQDAIGAKSSTPVPTINRIKEIANQLAAGSDPATSRLLLAELRAFLDARPRAAVSRDVQGFLSMGDDAATQLDVTIKAGGLLGDASSLRVFLLDYLGEIDPPAAGVLAAQILARYTTPDEWAVSLRNYARANPGPDGDTFLLSKERELLSNPEWIRKPSAGFLEAFDSIVHSHATSLAPKLTALLRDKENRAVAHAAYLTLDRLTITAPVGVIQQLVEQPALMEGREQTRANYVARADVRQSEQRSLVERYLLDPARTGAELSTFAGIYPNANYMISNNLLTSSATPSRDDLVKHDSAALEVVSQWLGDPRFEKLKPHLETMHARLQTFVQQATDNP